jgi:hypothetical protein
MENQEVTTIDVNEHLQIYKILQELCEKFPDETFKLIANSDKRTIKLEIVACDSDLSSNNSTSDGTILEFEEI